MQRRPILISIAIISVLAIIALIAIRPSSSKPTHLVDSSRPTTSVSTAALETESSTPICSGATSPQRYAHVVWIWMENKDTSDVMHSPKAPFLGQIGTQCGSSAKYNDLGLHPSEPNYIAATSGNTNGIHNDDDATHNAVNANNIFRQVRDAGLTTKTYAEDMPSNCAQQSSGKYASKHNPEPFYSAATDLAACSTDNVPFTQLATDLASGHLANFVTIVPNLCNDMHNCSVTSGDTWLRSVVGQLTASPIYRAEPTAIFVIFDESEGSKNMPFFAISQSISPGTNPDVSLNHFSTLRATEEMLGATTFLGKANDNPGLRSAFHL